ncbi:MAG: discoidin domain-containing protein [Lachnospiraceae bacterium]|nr:discoidin domain-containing protein [Lachnospiraceae bacterium]
MKKSLFTIMILIMCLFVFAGCAKSKESSSDEGSDKKAETEDNRTEEKEEDTSEKKKKKTKKERNDKKDNDEETETEKPGTSEKNPARLTESECRDKIDELRGSNPVRPAQEEILAELANIPTVSRVVDEQGAIFSEMDNDQRARLRRIIIDEVLWEESGLAKAIPVVYDHDREDADVLIPLDDAKAFFKEIYGEEDFVPAQYEAVDDEYMLFSYGDGDPWNSVEHMQYFEDDDYILVSGPEFYGDNSGVIELLGYADILFEKNPDSRYGVTLLYGRCRPNDIRVSYVNTSSELKPAAGKTYGGINLIDNDPATVWCEGVSGTGVGESITLKLDKKQPVFGIVIVNGYTADYTLYSNNGKVTDVQVDFGDGNVISGLIGGYAFEGVSGDYLAELNTSKVELDQPVMTDTITITITAAEKGAKYDDTCISGIKVY